MASYPWVRPYKNQGQDIAEFKHFQRWFDELGERPAVKRGMAAGTDLPPDPSTISDEERAAIRKRMYNQRAIPVPA